MSKLSIRKALESQLMDAMETAGITAVFGNHKLDTSTVQEYVRGVINFSEDHVTEVGPTPRIERGGKFHIGVNTHLRGGEDRNDEVAGLVRAAYPYGLDLVRDGIRVNIGTVDDSECVLDGSFLYSPVYVNFMVWSAVND